jgi:hypothetical protein
LQAGHSEEWLCSIFASLTEELEFVIRAAWLSMKILQRKCMQIAESSIGNRFRRATSALGHQSVMQVKY